MNCSWGPACKPEKLIFAIIDYRDPYMSAHVLMNLLNELGKRDTMHGFAEHLIAFSQLV